MAVSAGPPGCLSLDPSSVDAKRLLRDRLVGRPLPRWERVLFDPKKPGCVLVFGSMVSDELLQRWRSDGKIHVIGLVELYASILALRLEETFRRSANYLVQRFLAGPALLGQGRCTSMERAITCA